MANLSCRGIPRGLVLGAAVLLASFSLMASADPADKAADTPAEKPAGKPSGKWKLEMDNSSASEGEIVLRFAPVNMTPVDVTTKFPKGVGENEAARILRDSLKAALGKGYKIQVDDGEEVLIRKNGKTPKFEITQVSSTVEGLIVKIKRD